MSAQPERDGGESREPAAVLAEAKRALADAQVETARQLLDGLLARAPECAEANRLLGIACQMQGDTARAIAYMRRALAARPQDAVVHMNLGSLLQECGQQSDALAMLRRACELDPTLASAWYNLGKALKAEVDLTPARAAFEHALALDATHVDARVALAHAQASLGDVAGAAANYRAVLRDSPGDAQVWFALANMKTARFDAADVAPLQRLVAEAEGDDYARSRFGFALAKALEDNADYHGAFAALQAANRCVRSHAPWHAAAEHARIEAIAEAFAALPSPPPAGAASQGHEVIFIASLPRSGSTLTEQILASHSEVAGANEITDLWEVIETESQRRKQAFPGWVSSASADDWLRLGRDYLARTARWRANRPRFTDKNLVTWQLIGAVVRMLPGAKIVNARRDPLETCFSCYRQLFSAGNQFSYDLDDMADWYADYANLSRCWRRWYPERIFDHSYEVLLADPERAIRRLLDFCGLAFEPACLAFHLTQRTVRSTASAAQVRQPLRVTTPHSAHYAQELASTRDRLRRAGVMR